MQPSPKRPTILKSSIDSKLPLLDNRFGYVFAGLAVLTATGLVVLLENWVHHANLVLVYVLAVMATGLRYGSRPALAASMLSFLCFNFFLTEPRYTFEVARQDELTTLIFLFLIALVCGPVASRVRNQFILLKQANRYSEAMRCLGQALSVAENSDALWLATTDTLSFTLQVKSCVATADASGRYSVLPASSAQLKPFDVTEIEWSQRSAAPTGRLVDGLSGSEWTLFPICHEQNTIAYALVCFDPDKNEAPDHLKALIIDMLQQVAATWHRIQLVSELASARVKSEIEQLRSALLSSVSHDLKSPLAAMMGAAESLLLLDKQLDRQDRLDLVDTIMQESHRLDSYIQNLLDMTRLSYGSLNIERDWVSIIDVITSARDRIKRYHPEIKIDFNFLSPVPVLYVNAVLIEQALFNILENAVKFTPEKETILISVARKINRCVITIEDRGPGIAESLLEKIFELFYCVADGDNKPQGTGMGLAICRGMIRTHGGNVYAQRRDSGSPAQKSSGTRFVVELPITQPIAHSDSEPDPVDLAS